MMNYYHYLYSRSSFSTLISTCAYFLYHCDITPKTEVNKPKLQQLHVNILQICLLINPDLQRLLEYSFKSKVHVDVYYTSSLCPKK